MTDWKEGYIKSFGINPDNSDPSNIQLLRSGWFRVGYAYGYESGREYKSLQEAQAEPRHGAGIIRIDWFDNGDFEVTKEVNRE